MTLQNKGWLKRFAYRVLSAPAIVKKSIVAFIVLGNAANGYRVFNAPNSLHADVTLFFNASLTLFVIIFIIWLLRTDTL